MEILTAIVLGMCFENCADPRGFLQVQEFYQDAVNPSSYCTAGPIDVKNCLSIGSLDGVTIDEMTEANYGIDDCYCQKRVEGTCDIFICNEVKYKVMRLFYSKT